MFWWIAGGIVLVGALAYMIYKGWPATTAASATVQPRFNPRKERKEALPDGLELEGGFSYDPRSRVSRDDDDD